MRSVWTPDWTPSTRPPGDSALLPRGLRNYGSGLRNGFGPRRVRTLEGELEVEIPQVRETAEAFVSRRFPCRAKVLRSEPLRVLVIGAFVRGVSMRDIESLCEKAGLGKLAALFLDAVFLAVRPHGPKEGVLVAWGFTEAGERMRLSVMLGCANRTSTGSRSAAT